MFFAATTAGRSWRGAVIEAEERAKSGSPAYAYQLDWATPKDAGKFGAPHASDIQFVFDNIDKPGATAIGPQAQAMADQMSETFIALPAAAIRTMKLIPRWEPTLCRGARRWCSMCLRNLRTTRAEPSVGCSPRCLTCNRVPRDRGLSPLHTACGAGESVKPGVERSATPGS